MTTAFSFSDLEPLGVLISGGLDSAILLGEAVAEHVVSPLYIRTGLYWEPAELEHLRRYLAALEAGDDFQCRPAGPRLRPLRILELPIADVYGRHWSLTGIDVPDEDTPDEAVFLPGRNLLLLSKALLWCHLNSVPALALGTLGSNPFPDATQGFFDGFAQLVSTAVAGRVEVRRPYAHLHKGDVLQRGRGLPLQWTFSCIHPLHGRHCGRCNKCAERKRAFRDAGIPDPTDYCKD
jgi:7-cyano-7-deazaguanine synthase